MAVEILHAAFDLVMGLVLLYWVGGKLADLGRRDSVAVIWECLMVEIRKLRTKREPEPAGEFTTAVDAT